MKYGKFIMLICYLRASHGVDADIEKLIEFIKMIGKQDADGSYHTTFGDLFKSDEVQQTLEVSVVIALNMLLKALSYY